VSDGAPDEGSAGETVADVDHEGPSPDANEVWSRGAEGRDADDREEPDDDASAAREGAGTEATDR